MKNQNLFWSLIGVVVLPIVIIIILGSFSLGVFGLLPFLLLHWLVIVSSIKIAKDLSRKASSIPRLIGVFFLALLVAFFGNFGGQALLNSVYNPLSNTGPGGILAGFIVLGFIFLIFIFNYLAISIIVIRQGLKNNLYGKITEYVLYGLALLIGLTPFAFPLIYLY